MGLYLLCPLKRGFVWKLGHTVAQAQANGASRFTFFFHSIILIAEAEAEAKSEEKRREEKVWYLKLNRIESKQRRIEDGESRNVLRYDPRSFRLLAIHGQGPCLDRSSPGRKAREVGEGSGDQKG